MDYDAMTKAQLQEELGRMREEMKEKDYSIRHLTEQITKNLKDSEGWLVQAPNPLFDGSAFGLRFIAGQLFLQKDRPVEHFIHEPTKESTMKKLGYTDEEIAAVREREANFNSAQAAAETFRDDFHYQVEYFTPDQAGALKARMAERAVESSQAASKEAQLLDQLKTFGGTGRL